MPVKNITIDVANDWTDSFADINATANDLMLMNFYNAGAYIRLLVASEKLGGLPNEIVNNVGVGYNITIVKSKLALLQNGSLTYKLFKINELTQEAIEIYNGNATVSGSQISEPAQVVHTNHNYVPREIKQDTPNAAITTEDRLLLVSPDENASINLLLPNARSIKGKIYEIRNVGLGNVVVKGYDDLIQNYVQLFVVNGGDGIDIRAIGSTEKDYVLFQ